MKTRTGESIVFEFINKPASRTLRRIETRNDWEKILARNKKRAISYAHFILSKPHKLSLNYERFRIEYIKWLYQQQNIESYTHIKILYQERELTLERIPFLLNYIDDIFVKNQYDIQREKVADKVIVDAGSCEGTFSLLCLLQGAKKVIAIDPSKSMCEYFRKTAIDNGFGKSFQIIQAGLWDKKMKGYTQNAQEIGTLSISKKGPDSEEIVLTALDSIHKRVDLIKMDIEGAEKHALLGAKTCMKKYKPTLCVTTYHHKGDQAILSNLIQKIEPSYRISHHNFAEPILIAHAPQKN